MESGPLRQPGSDFGVLVGSIIIDDQVYVQVLRHGLLDLMQETQELLVQMTRLALGDRLYPRHIQAGEQGYGVVSDVVLRDPLDVAYAHGQQRLGPIQCLALRFSSKQTTIALSGGFRYGPIMSRTFSTKNGSVESLNVFCRCGCNEKLCSQR